MREAPKNNFFFLALSFSKPTRERSERRGDTERVFVQNNRFVLEAVRLRVAVLCHRGACDVGDTKRLFCS